MLCVLCWSDRIYAELRYLICALCCVVYNRLVQQDLSSAYWRACSLKSYRTGTFCGAPSLHCSDLALFCSYCLWLVWCRWSTTMHISLGSSSASCWLLLFFRTSHSMCSTRGARLSVSLYVWLVQSASSLVCSHCFTLPHCTRVPIVTISIVCPSPRTSVVVWWSKSVGLLGTLRLLELDEVSKQFLCSYLLQRQARRLTDVQPAGRRVRWQSSVILTCAYMYVCVLSVAGSRLWLSAHIWTGESFYRYYWCNWLPDCFVSIVLRCPIVHVPLLSLFQLIAVNESSNFGMCPPWDLCTWSSNRNLWFWSTSLLYWW